MRNFALAAAMIGSFTGTAHSQALDKDKGSKTPMQIEQEERQQSAKDVDRAYNAVIKRSRETAPNVASDPWKNVRPPDKK